MWNSYHSVTTLDEAVQLLADYGTRARVIAGGTDILIEMERGARPDVDVLIDISRVAGLDEITLADGIIHMGALVNHNHVVGSEAIRQHALPLAQASWEVGAPQIRNRGTIAGNLITASPANDTISPLMALRAWVTLLSIRGERDVALKDFYSGFRQTVMQPDEIMTAIHMPVMPETARGVFIKLGLRRAQAISVVNVTAVIDFKGDTVKSAAITLGSVAPTIVHATGAEHTLVGRSLSDEIIQLAAQRAADAEKPIDDVRSTADYRREMIRVLVRRSLRQIRDGVVSHVPEKPAMLWGHHAAKVQSAIDGASVHNADEPIRTTVNGQTVTVTTGQDKTLLRWLREDVGLNGTKEGCAEGECGACTVFLDDVAVMACMVPAPRAHDAEIITVEGLVNQDELHPIQSAFVDTGAVQCGYCTPGFLMSGAKLLEENSAPSDEQINTAISGNLCRCTGYYKIIDAFKQASAKKETAKS